jgi:3-hexulose-6-phosphate synthase
LVFADIKVMDGGSVVPRIAFEAGADMVSVLAVADDSTIEATLECAEEYGKDVLVDMCSVIDMEQRAKEVDAMGPTYICVHVGYDIQDTGVDPIEELKKIEFVNTAKAIAGGIKLANFEEAVKSPADLVIVGGGLYKQNDMHAVAKQMRAIVDRIKTERGS